MVFNPNLESAPAPEQPVYSNISTGAEGGMATVAGNALEMLGGLFSQASERRQQRESSQIRQTFLNTLESVRALVDNGRFNEAQIAAGQAVSEYVGANGQFDAELRAAASSISGLPEDSFRVSPQALMAEAENQRRAALVQDNTFQAYMYLEQRANPELTPEQLFSVAEERYNRNNANAEIIAEGELTGQFNYEAEGRQAIFGMIDDFTQTSLGGLIDAVDNNVPVELNAVTSVETRFQALQMRIQRSLINASDDQRAEVQTQLDGVTNILTNLKTILSTEGQQENLNSFVNQMIMSRELTDYTPDQLVGAVLATNDLASFFMEGQDASQFFRERPELYDDVMNRVQITLNEQSLREAYSALPRQSDGTVNRNGLITIEDVPADIRESVQGIDETQLVSSLRVEGLLLGGVSTQEVTSASQADQLTNSTYRLGTWLLSTEGRPLTPNLLNNLGLTEGLSDRLNIIESMGLNDEAEAAARVALRSGLSTQMSSVRGYLDRIESVNEEAGLRWNPETEEYEITNMDYIEAYATEIGLSANMMVNEDGVISLNPLRRSDMSQWRGQLRQRLGRLDEAFQYRESLRLIEGAYNSLQVELPEDQAVAADTISALQDTPTGAGSEPIMFIDRLAMSESSGNPQAEITIGDGRVFVGLLQFGEARLQDYKNATGEQFTQEEFRNDPELQRRVNEWHIGDIDRAIDRLGGAAAGYSRDGLRAVAHLGGITGMRRFVESGGEYNPSDELGTSLQDYYDRFSGQGEIRQETLPPAGESTDTGRISVSAPQVDVPAMDTPAAPQTQPVAEQPQEAQPQEGETPRPAQPVVQGQNEEIARSLREIAQGVTFVSGAESAVAERANDVATRFESGEQIDMEEINRLISDALQLAPSEEKDQIVDRLYRVALQMRGG